MWTGRNNGPSAISDIRKLFEESNFTEIRIDNTPDDSFTIGTHGHNGTVQPLQAGETFLGLPDLTRCKRKEV